MAAESEANSNPRLFEHVRDRGSRRNVLENPMLWTQDALWAKAKTYVGKALAQDREGADFPLFASHALEFLARATVASVHPALLADPKEDSNLLYVFNLRPQKKEKRAFSPNSIRASIVFSRCTLI